MLDSDGFIENEHTEAETKAIPPVEEADSNKAKKPGGMVSAGIVVGGAKIQVDIASCGTFDDTIGIRFVVGGKASPPVAFPKEWFAHELRIKAVEQFSTDVRKWLLAGNVEHVKATPQSSILRPN